MFRSVLAAALLLVEGADRLAAGDWPRFRGPDGSGVSREQGLLQSWPQAGPPLLWQTQGAGRGYGSVAIRGERCYTLGDDLASDRGEFLAAFSREDGKPLWTQNVGPAWTNGEPSWQGARSTPTVDEAVVCVLGAHGDLVCFDVLSGRPLWRRNLATDFHGIKADAWGYSESVLIDQDRVVCTPGGPRSTMVALEKRTGQLIWKCPRKSDRGAGHASIVVAYVGGSKLYLQTTGSGAMAVRAHDGKLLWSNRFDSTVTVAPNPVIHGDMVFLAAGYDHGGALIQQFQQAGGISAMALYGWRPELANKHGGVILMGERLFGDSDDRGIPYCADLKTGKILWRSRGSGHGSVAIVGAEGCLYLRYSDGTMALAKADSAAYRESGSFRIPGSGEWPSWSHPAIADGRLYLREQDAILCYDIRRPTALVSSGSE